MTQGHCPQVNFTFLASSNESTVGQQQNQRWKTARTQLSSPIQNPLSSSPQVFWCLLHFWRLSFKPFCDWWTSTNNAGMENGVQKGGRGHKQGALLFLANTKSCGHLGCWLLQGSRSQCCQPKATSPHPLPSSSQRRQKRSIISLKEQMSTCLLGLAFHHYGSDE
jgi:hypothetical protein